MRSASAAARTAVSGPNARAARAGTAPVGKSDQGWRAPDTGGVGSGSCRRGRRYPGRQAWRRCHRRQQQRGGGGGLAFLPGLAGLAGFGGGIRIVAAGAGRELRARHHILMGLLHGAGYLDRIRRARPRREGQGYTKQGDQEGAHGANIAQPPVSGTHLRGNRSVKTSPCKRLCVNGAVDTVPLLADNSRHCLPPQFTQSGCRARAAGFSHPGA